MAWSTVLEKLTDAQPVKNFSAFYGTLGSITVFKEPHWTISWAG